MVPIKLINLSQTDQKKKNTQINNIKNERRLYTTDIILKKSQRDTKNNSMQINLTLRNLEEMNKCLENYKPPKLTQNR